MELTKEQVLQIDNYISACGIKYYDVKMEIVDHFASILELRLEEEPDLDFKKAIVEEHKKFSNNGFKKLLEIKTDSVHKRFFKSSLKHLFSFFTLPKVIITIAIFLGLQFIMNSISDTEIFFNILQGFALLLSFRLLFNVNMRNDNKISFLSLSITLRFFNVFHLFTILFQFLDNINGEGFNNIHLLAYMVLFLFYWSGEYVYYQNKKEVQEQYPNVIV
ncbi:hypothetical protein [Tenacibaculum aquimarinum]|uniref:hypothetical protein n=1 Tax=Tenacibaculum aquimarinum TaxID=2910675 RepID=UPI001F0AFA2D|nr:hypothetical protein [Tenacibaculum aquimarinum]MCH3883646.1 hypothetical protein [Tenacibaculum aquimarinum]